MTSQYIPDNWVVIFMNGEYDPHYKVLAGWSGGYTQGDSWRMNSGITRVEEGKNRYSFYGASGSVYHCGKKSYGLKMNNAYIWNRLKDLYVNRVEMMPEDTDWMTVDWILSDDE